jgi:hypothetical protein
MNEMGGACGTYLEEERHLHGFGEEPAPRGRLGPIWEGKIILKWIEDKAWGRRRHCTGSGQGKVVDCCVRCNKTSGSTGVIV